MLLFLIDSLLHVLYLRSESPVDKQVVNRLEDEEGHSVDAVRNRRAEKEEDGRRGVVELMEEVSRRIFPPLVSHVDVQIHSVQRNRGYHAANCRENEDIAHRVEYELRRKVCIASQNGEGQWDHPDVVKRSGNDHRVGGRPDDVGRGTKGEETR